MREELDERVFTVAGNGAGVADAGRRWIWGFWVLGWRVTCQTGEDALAKGSKDVSAGVELLEKEKMSVLFLCKSRV